MSLSGWIENIIGLPFCSAADCVTVTVLLPTVVDLVRKCVQRGSDNYPSDILKRGLTSDEGMTEELFLIAVLPPCAAT